MSAVVFAVAYRMLHLGPRISTVSAFGAGAVVNFVTIRFWAWARHHRSGLGRDLLRYAMLAGTTALAATGVTSATDWFTGRAGFTPTWQAVFVEASYLGTCAAMFLVKFVLLDLVVFRGSSGAR